MEKDFVISQRMYQDAYERGMTLSAYLETLDPTESLSQADRRQLGQDAFTRQLRKLDIRTRSIPEMGVQAHSWERFVNPAAGDDEAPQRAALAAEWLTRQFRQAYPVFPRGVVGARGLDVNRRNITTDSPLSDVLWPTAQDAMMRYQQLEPSILSHVVGRTRGITGNKFEAFYLADSTVEASARLKRVEEYAELPSMRISGSDHSIQAHKYGRKLEVSYEAMRRMSLDLVSWAVGYIKAKADNDKFLHAVDVIVNGDGNSGTAATNTAGSTLDSGASGALTLKMHLAWGMLWSRPYQCNVAIAQDAGILALLLLNAGSANLPPQTAVTAGGAVGAVTLARPIYGGMVAINESTAPSVKLVGLDNRYTLEMVTEVGANISEVAKVASAQYDYVTLSEIVGFDIMTLGQNRTLGYTA